MRSLILFSIIILTSVLLYSKDSKIWYNTKENKFISKKKLSQLVKQSNIVYVGETHDQMECHLAQLEAIKMLNKKTDKIAVGFEMLNKTLQPILDDYINGKLTEEEFLKKVNWEKEWGFDFKLYKPIFDYIKENNLKAFALNVPRKIVSKVARGGLESLSEDEKKLIAREIKLPENKDYINYLKETFSGHAAGPMSKIMTFDNYLMAMSVWNETMGEVAADFLNKNPDYSFVVVAGNGHVMFNAAIPWSVKRRTKNLKHLSIYTENINNIDNVKEIKKYADIIWFVKFSENKKEKK